MGLMLGRVAATSSAVETSGGRAGASGCGGAARRLEEEAEGLLELTGAAGVIAAEQSGGAGVVAELDEGAAGTEDTGRIR